MDELTETRTRDSTLTHLSDLTPLPTRSCTRRTVRSARVYSVTASEVLCQPAIIYQDFVPRISVAPSEGDVIHLSG